MEDAMAFRDGLSEADVTSLCDEAMKKWNSLGPRAREGRFRWRGNEFIVTHSTFALKVETLSGEPVAMRWD
jgi:hypothetical protein